ncbi:MAG: hypothetical protein A2Z21_06835 [Candidatus Fraserbacteria bacterium RBG_16_55_9]|uniref:Uncharacterized protein TP-0789 domain-containing protein n=1 Tax=Fraserbacteria sp. (strain RBG_16_55_9) TaxID=1817864 RepID=A0A1F5UTU4_FRAXR|nr:MAG: hypothetical protein A2Z21_06835 [Candidatus Fraserbacteria bacterium RBG_16_55_9]
MKKRIFGLASIALLAFFSLYARTQTEPTAQEILAKALSVLYPDIFISEVSLENIKVDGATQAYSMKVYRKGEKSLIEFLTPEDQKGQKVLRVGDDIKIFFPSSCEFLAVGTQFGLVGSIFSYGDVARLDLAADYSASLLGVEDLGGKSAYKLELQAKDASIAYDRVLYWIEVETFLPMRAEYYTASGELLKWVTYVEFKELAGAVRPSKAIMESALEEGARTILTTLTMEAQEDLPDEVFTEEYHIKECKG